MRQPIQEVMMSQGLSLIEAFLTLTIGVRTDPYARSYVNDKIASLSGASYSTALKILESALDALEKYESDVIFGENDLCVPEDYE